MHFFSWGHKVQHRLMCAQTMLECEPSIFNHESLSMRDFVHLFPAMNHYPSHMIKPTITSLMSHAVSVPCHMTWDNYYIADESCSFTSAVLWGRIKGRTFWKVFGCVTQCTFNLVPNFGELVSMSCVIHWTFIQTGEDYARLWVRQAQVKVPTICGRVRHVSGLHAIDGMTKFTSGREIGECGHGWEQQILYTVYLTI